MANRKTSSLAMTFDLVGRVENLTFQPEKEVYWPIFEAVKNSLDAIEEAAVLDGKVTIEIEREEPPLALGEEPAPKETKRVQNIIITDNGKGFDGNNLESFGRLDSRKKKRWGGKGVGRLYWIKTFDEVVVDSIFKDDNDTLRQVQFVFKLPNGFVEHRETPLTAVDANHTVVKLIGYKAEFERYFRKKRLSTLKNDLIRHFMSYLMFHPSVNILLKDGDELVSINKDDLPERVTDQFEIQGKPFTVHHMKLKSVEPPGHHLYYCAHDRVVGTPQDVDPSIGIPRTTKIEVPDGESFYYTGYVSSPVLDESVNTERTRFTLIDRAQVLGGIDLDSVAITFEQVRKRCNESVSSFLSQEIEQLQKTKEQRLDEILNKELPGFSYLKEFSPEELASIPVGASSDEIMKEVAVLHLRNRVSTEREAEELLQHLDVKEESIERLQKECSEKLERLARVHAADLAQYVTGRASVLHLFSRLLELGSDGKYEYEKTLHKLIFPMRADETKEKRSFSVHSNNLWIFDEKFAYYDYIASDLQLKSHKPLVEASQSEDRPDVSIYFFSDDYSAPAFDSIVIIEFKRPGRTDVGSKDEDPINQVTGYINEIRDRMLDFKGREVPALDNTKFFCYIVCDTQTKYIRDTIVKNYTMSPSLDGGGYFANLTQHNAYVELLSYRKLLSDAYKRNLAFFRKLKLPENLLAHTQF